MSHNALSRGISTIPMWVIQAVVGVFLSSGVAWATWASVSSWKHEQRIAVVETRVDGVKDDIVEIKDGQKEMNRKLDHLIENQDRNSRHPYDFNRPLYGGNNGTRSHQ